MTSYASMRSAVEALKLGAVDYVAKPFDHDELLDTVSRVLQQQASQQNIPPDVAEQGDQQPSMIGNCPAMQTVYSRIRKTAPADVTVLIQGESGTGKELVARALHQQSKRARAPLICVNCAAIPETLIESELFGHEKGAFTGANAARTGLVEAADRGTLFLDEIGELPPDAQARLLRVLQEGEIRKIGSVETRHVDVRLIAATHRDLHALSKTGEFRLDLYYRLNVMQIDFPRCETAKTTFWKSPTHCSPRPVAATTAKACASPGPPGASSATPPGPATCVNWKTPWSAASSLPKAILSTRRPGARPAVTFAPASAIKAASIDDSPEDDGDHDPEDLSLEDYFQHFVLEHQDQMSETELAQKLGISRKCLWERRQRLGIPRKKNPRRNVG